VGARYSSACHTSRTYKEDGRLLTFKIRFPDLILAVDYAHKQVFMYQWNKGGALKFLEYHCIDKNVQVRIYEQAEKCRMLRVALEEGSHCIEEEKTVIHQDARKDPDKYKNWKPLPCWKQEVNARLHRLLSNSIKTAYFRNMAWLKLLPLGADKTFGGQVSENYLALVQILPWAMLPVRSWEEVT
jgi:hypothetical protein